MSTPETPPQDRPPQDRPPFPVRPEVRRQPQNMMILLIIVSLFVLALLWSFNSTDKISKIDYGFFRKQLREKNIATLTISGSLVSGQFVDPPVAPPSSQEVAASGTEQDQQGTNNHAEKEKEGANDHAEKEKKEEPRKLTKDFAVTLPANLELDGELDREIRGNPKITYRAEVPNDGTTALIVFYLVVTVGLLVGFWMMFRRTREQVLGGGMLAGFARSPARRYAGGDKPVTFADVAGLEGVKSDLQEIVEFLKNPKKFQRLGGRVPKGILLMGPPGTGKTLLGRAVAGEAGVPFFSINGSEFIQMFVGVGASRVRDLFATAKENAPCILFIDEIDAVGRHRGTGLGGSHDEREQTLNQILGEMDGFTQTESVIVMAATNRPDVLDPALLRPGRFDRHIVVDRPSFKGRVEIFRVHTRGVPLADDVDLERLAGGTVGLTGADIRNLVNEAALWASRQDKQHVEMADFDYARDKVLMGAKREEVLSPKEKSMTAYHEAGHTLTAWFTPGIDRLHKVSIIPRGRALGVTQLLPDEDRVNIAETELHSRLLFMLGGRAAEKLVFSEFTAGSENDLKQATQLARRMVARWGMSERLGPVAYRDGEEHPFLGREIAEERQYSEHTAQLIDEEVVRILRQAADGAMHLLETRRDQLTSLSEALQREETLDEKDIEQLIGPSINRREPLSNGSAPTVPPTVPPPDEPGNKTDAPPA